MKLLHSLIFGSSPHTCPWWFEYALDNPLRRRLHDTRAILSRFVRQGDTVVDVGIGFGICTLPLADLVGPQGRVIAVDIQQKMLDATRRRAQRRGLADRIEFRKAEQDSLGISSQVDFVNAFWMFHEVANKRGVLGEIRGMLRSGGRLLITEPKGHVSPGLFEKITRLVRESGFRVSEGPKVRLSRSIICVAE